MCNKRFFCIFTVDNSNNKYFTNVVHIINSKYQKFKIYRWMSFPVLLKLNTEGNI